MDGERLLPHGRAGFLSTPMEDEVALADHNYTLQDKVPVLEPDLLRWARWFEEADRSVAVTHLPGGVYVSTVFLGTDHNWTRRGPPLLFETMIFGGPYDQKWSLRCSTWKQAEIQHQQSIIAAVSKMTDADWR